MSNIFIKSAREQIVYGATIDYKEWHMIDEIVFKLWRSFRSDRMCWTDCQMPERIKRQFKDV